MKAKLYLIPTPIGFGPFNQIFPDLNIQLVPTIKYFIVENVRTSRRFLKKMNPAIDINQLTFFVLNKKTSSEEFSSFLNPIKDGYSIGLMSEAGVPGVADPGADIVQLAHQKNINVIPLIGPSSILLSLMASGLNGQSFAFNGYLPIKGNEKILELKKYEHRSTKENQTQIFIETPYRNQALIEFFIKNLSSNTLLCIAANINTEDEFIKTMKVKEWKNKLPEIHKKPAIFLFLA